MGIEVELDVQALNLKLTLAKSTVVEQTKCTITICIYILVAMAVDNQKALIK